jgi:hypothetical protein
MGLKTAGRVIQNARKVVAAFAKFRRGQKDMDIACLEPGLRGWGPLAAFMKDMALT